MAYSVVSETTADKQQGEEMGALSLLNLVKSEEEGLCSKRGPCGLDFVFWKYSSDNFDLYNLVMNIVRIDRDDS